jgi:hypothetical protein
VLNKTHTIESKPKRQWVMINRVVRLMWPDLTGAILDEVVKGLKPTLQGVLADVRAAVLCVCEGRIGLGLMLAVGVRANFQRKRGSSNLDSSSGKLNKTHTTLSPTTTTQLPLPSFLAIEDITLGPTSLLDADHADRAALASRLFTLGDRPIRVAGMKVYSTAEDACTLETPLMWGSKAAIELQVYVRVGPLRLVIPVSVRAVFFLFFWGG